jgi:hypothetical protein
MTHTIDYNVQLDYISHYQATQFLSIANVNTVMVALQRMDECIELVLSKAKIFFRFFFT